MDGRRRHFQPPAPDRHAPASQLHAQRKRASDQGRRSRYADPGSDAAHFMDCMPLTTLLISWTAGHSSWSGGVQRSRSGARSLLCTGEQRTCGPRSVPRLQSSSLPDPHALKLLSHSSLSLSLNSTLAYASRCHSSSLSLMPVDATDVRSMLTSLDVSAVLTLASLNLCRVCKPCAHQRRLRCEGRES
eukprot:1207370-Rhodomonas_salina.1